MKKHRDNCFTKKFDLLNSQEHNEDIRWSSSESSDYENISNYYNPSPLNFHRKRKRKKRVHKSLSNLSIVSVEQKHKPSNTDKSPIISKLHSDSKRHTENFNVKINSSPILKSKVQSNEPKRKVKSPVLLLKCKSTIVSPTIKKRLFLTNNQSEKLKIKDSTNIPSIQLETSHYFASNVKDANSFKSMSRNNESSSNSNELYCTKEILLNECEGKIHFNTKWENQESLTSNNINKTIDASKPRTKKDLVKRVQSYFDSHFGSDCASQQSISECETLTPKSTSKNSDDLEISSSLTQNGDNALLPVQASSSVASNGSWEININTEKKKNKYKKDGLAYRLDCLLRKQNASISLWQHEKFLAKNSNFIIPKSEHIVFRIQKVHFKYGSYLIETIDLCDERHLIFINGYYVNSNCKLAPNIILKLHKPYKILDLGNQYKLVINVCKFECVIIGM